MMIRDAFKNADLAGAADALTAGAIYVYARLKQCIEDADVRSDNDLLCALDQMHFEAV